jgi:hypothetical protein
MGTNGKFAKRVFLIAGIYGVIVLLPQWVYRGGLDLTGGIDYDSNRCQAVQTINASRCPGEAIVRLGHVHPLRP